MDNRSQRGSLAVEGALVLPIIFLGVFAIIYVSIIHYQNISASAAAMQAANKVASSWAYVGSSNPNALKNTEKANELLTYDDFRDNDPYRFIWDGKLGSREKNGREYALLLVDSTNNLSHKIDIEDFITLEKKGSFLMHYVEVTVNRTYINPLGRLLEQVGVKERESNVIRARTVITSPTEFIRNVSLIEELMHQRKLEKK